MDDIRRTAGSAAAAAAHHAAAMRAPLVPLVPLVLLAALAAAAPDDQFVTILQKGIAGWEPGAPLGPFYIPDGQCSGVLDDLLNCRSPDGRSTPVAVRVAVRDVSRSPRVALHDSLRSASVLRAPPCSGEAAVTVRLACHAPGDRDDPDGPDGPYSADAR